jgi:ubiquitin-conjugating enzyme E2 variant
MQSDGPLHSSSYSIVFRKVEVASIVAFFTLLGWLALRLSRPALNKPWLVLCAVLLAYVTADFLSGLVHWLGDTWGSPDVPLFGPSLIRPFREHHIDQTAITRHDFVETNGANCLISLPAAVGSLLVPLEGGNQVALFAATFFGSLMFWIFATNQFHKWAHLEKPAPPIRWLQRVRLILPPDHHAIHHAWPFSQYYCITVGWLNWPLMKLRFFPLLENMVSSTCGAVPREATRARHAGLRPTD